jgi:hypothetical protein
MAVFVKWRMEDNHMRGGTGLEGESAGREVVGGEECVVVVKQEGKRYDC